MRLPQMQEIPSSRSVVEEFRGVNYSERIGAGEFSQMENLTGDHYPVLSTRGVRGSRVPPYGQEYDQIDAIFARDTIAFISQPKDLASDSRTLTVNGDVTTGTNITFDGGTVEEHALKGRLILVGGKQYKVADNTDTTITTKISISPPIANDTIIYPGEGGKEDPNRDGYMTIEERKVSPDVASFLSGDETPTNRWVVRTGAYFVSFPDKVWVNSTNPDEGGSLEASAVAGDGNSVTFAMSDSDGNVITPDYITDTEPLNPSDGNIWLDTRYKTVKKWDQQGSEWIPVTTTYARLESSDHFFDDPVDEEWPWKHKFNVGDGVTITGFKDRYPDLKDMEGTSVIVKIAHDYIVIRGIVLYHDPVTQQYSTTVIVTTSTAQPITFARKVPDMDFVVESGNRLWGCKYGRSESGEFVNEIYASKLGDFKNWNVFEGTSTDSYAASVGTSGPFTGAFNYNGRPVFFKQNFIHQVYGNYPSNYQIQTLSGMGVKSGSEKSISLVNGVLIYHSAEGFVSFDGSLPQRISPALDGKNYFGAVSECCRNKYYVSVKENADQQYHDMPGDLNGNGVLDVGDLDIMEQIFAEAPGGHPKKDPVRQELADVNQDKVVNNADLIRLRIYINSGKVYRKEQPYICHLYVFDPKLGTWHRESGLNVTDMIALNDQLFMLVDGTIVTEFGRYNFLETPDTKPVKWSATTGVIGLGSPDKKYITRISVRMALEAEANVSFFAQYDSMDQWEHLCTLSRRDMRTFTVPIKPKRCDHLRLRMQGEGGCKIYSIAYTTENGSDL